MTLIDAQIANLKNKITAKKLQLEHRVTILTGGIRDVDERTRLQSEIDQLTAAKKDLEQQVSALDLEQRRSAGAEERRRMDQERAESEGQ